MYARSYLVIAVGLFFLQLIVGCGNQSTSNWLIKTEQETITVSEAGDLWNNLDTSLQARLLAEDNTIGSYLSYLSREIMIKQIIDEENILHSVQIIHLKSNWLTSASARALTDSLTVDVLAAVNEDDMLKYRELLGKTIWYSRDNQSFGPVRLPDLPWDAAFIFDSINPGERFNLSGSTFLLDSLVVIPEFLESEMGRDPVFIRTNLARSRVNRQIDSLQNEVCSDIQIDSNAVETFLHNRNSLQNTTSLLIWSGGAITPEQADEILAFNSFHQAPDSLGFQHISTVLTNQVNLIIQEDIFANKYPAAYDYLIEQAEIFAYNQAKQILFKKHIADSIIVTEQMLIEGYNSQNNLPITPETRIFESFVTPSTGFFNLVNGQLTALNQNSNDNFFGYLPTLSTTSNTLSKAVTERDLPSVISDAIFEKSYADSLWYGPIQLADSTYMYYSLVSIIPEHPVAFENIRESIQQNLILHIEEQKEAEWMCNLETHCKLKINLEILADLPENPILWSTRQ